MSNAAKLKKRAAELEQKKQYDKALALYIQVLDESDASVEEADVSLYNRVGDLMFRLGNVTDALTYYEKAADLYAERGFHNNAIALCNKVLRQSPGRTSVYYKLGKISATKGFKSDAKKNFLEYADRMRGAGNPDEAFRALKEFADLCPDQDDIRLMLADQLSRENRRDEALEQLQTLHSKLQTEGRGVEARATVERMQALDPSIAPRGSNDAPAIGEGDLVFLDVSYDEPTSRAAIPLLEIDAPPGLELTTLDDGMDDESIADDGLRLITGFTPSESMATVNLDASPLDGIETIESFEDIDDDAAAVMTSDPLDLIVDVGEATPPMSAPDEAIELEEPHDASPSSEPAASATFDAMLVVASDEFRMPGQFDASDLDASGDEEAIAFDDELTIAREDVVGVEAAPVPDAAPEAISALDTSDAAAFDLGLDRDPAIDLAIADLVEERASHADLSDLPMLDVGDDEGIGPSASADDDEVDDAVDDGWSSDSPAANPPYTPRREHDAALDLLGARLDAAPDDWAARRRFAEALLDAGERERGLAQLEGAMLGLEQEGRLDDAVAIADELVRLVPASVAHHQKRVEYAVRANDRGRLISAYVELADSLLRAGEPEKSHAVYRRVTELAPDDLRARAGLRLFEPAMRATPLAPPAIGRETPWRASRAIPSEPAPARARTPAAAAPVAPPVAAENEFVDLGQWLRGQQQPRSTRMYTAAPQPTGDEDADFAEMLRRFKQGVAANVDEEDSDSHYDLGVAYREMGLVDEAIAEFQKALRGSESRLRACEALGQCFLDKGQFAVAATVLTRAVESAPGDDHQLVGVLYLSGYAAEALERWRDAQSFYQRVFAVDIQFRDVAERLTTIERMAK